MLQAMLWGVVAGSAILIGAFLSLYVPIKKKFVGYIMSYGTGVLMGAAAYELLWEWEEEAGLKPIIIGFVTGALIFTVFDMLLARKGGGNRKRSEREETAGSGLGLFLGTIMDSIPEAVMLGASLVVSHTVSLVLVVAIFISNIPEGLSSTLGMIKSGYSRKKIWFLWMAVLLATTLGSWGGYVLLDGASAFTLAIIASFAGGGIISMLASTMMPEAFNEGGPIVGFVASMGLLTSLALV